MPGLTGGLSGGSSGGKLAESLLRFQPAKEVFRQFPPVYDPKGSFKLAVKLAETPSSVAAGSKAKWRLSGGSSGGSDTRAAATEIAIDQLARWKRDGLRASDALRALGRGDARIGGWASVFAVLVAEVRRMGCGG